ncbi:hypothetical protein [Endozoicomonas atrinae]|uniref:hypothetical protein n=1 Tax=Endozoicomonas atrinae TaxID=1333660 RepID=UPI0008242CFE|nr:hypothetical protein [Endozoicomonas atrinae]
MLIINPKRVSESLEIKPYWYNYYAGYSHTFTHEIIKSAELQQGAIILDPWNGAGTTTLMASINGYKSVGIDLNPVMKIIATAKQLTKNDVQILEKKIEDISFQNKVSVNIDDPLSVWFDYSAVESIRKVESIITGAEKYYSTHNKVSSMIAWQCLMYTALFNCVREYLCEFIPSNPTWIKKPKDNLKKISFCWRDFRNKYSSLVRDMIDGISLIDHDWDPELSKIMIGTSCDMELKNQSCDLVLTSPPYCTRIDYGVATLPELSILCVSGTTEINNIRRMLMGTTTVPKSTHGMLDNLGDGCLRFIRNVENHYSKASKTYYYKNFVQYFFSLQKSIREVNRVLKFRSKCIFVVQDSYYKDLHCDLPGYVIEMAESNGLRLLENVQFESKNNMANLNLKAKLYRKKNVAYENVLIFEKD